MYALATAAFGVRTLAYSVLPAGRACLQVAAGRKAETTGVRCAPESGWRSK